MFELKSKQISEIVGGILEGAPDLVFTNVNRIENLRENDIAFLSSYDFLEFAENSKGLILLSEHLKDKIKRNDNLIYVENAYEAFVKLLVFIDTNLIKKRTGIDKSATVHPSSKVDDSAVIMENVVIQENCQIGKNVIIYSNVSLYPDTKIGDNSIVHSGAVIGSDGFGYADLADGSYFKIPQLGNVVIGKNVEIGANTTIDRSVAGSTIISDGVKIDNLVHIGHNTVVGENSAFAAQVGIAGSVKIGKRVRMGGQVGSAGHIEIVDDVTIIAKSGLSKSVTKKGTYFGSPIKPQREAFRIEAALRNLPEALGKIQQIEKKIEE